MAKIILDEQKVKDIVLPNIEKVLNKLKEVNTYAKKQIVLYQDHHLLTFYIH